MELYLYHYYDAEFGPFRNLSALTVDEARSVEDRLRQRNVFASKRADDYMIIRRELEQRAREQFVGKGGKPAKTYPHYMTLGPCEWLKDWYKDGCELRIPLEAFLPCSISFTYGDLFPTMRYRDDKIYREQVYTKDEVLALVDELGFPQDWNKDGRMGPERYIEVQVWDEEVIREYVDLYKLEGERYRNDADRID